MDNAFKTGAYPSCTTAELRDALARHISHATATGLGDHATIARIEAEIERREAVAAGDVSRMTQGERLRFVRQNEERV